MMKKTASVSVVIPCFQCTQTLERAVASVAAQTVSPAELILVDDASGDGTRALLHSLSDRYEPGWIKLVLLDQNVGAASARNSGWRIATQSYISFLDADDSWHPEKLAIQYGYMLNNPNVVLCGHQCIFLKLDSDRPTLTYEWDVTTVDWLGLLFKNAFSTPTVMLRRLIPFRFKEGKRCAEDLLLWQQIALAGLDVVRLEVPLAYVHKRLYGAGGLSGQLWAMEVGELENFLVLYRNKNINIFILSLASFFSVVKYVRRIFVSGVNNLRLHINARY